MCTNFNLEPIQKNYKERKSQAHDPPNLAMGIKPICNQSPPNGIQLHENIKLKHDYIVIAIFFFFTKKKSEK